MIRIKNLDAMLLTSFISTLFYSASGPCINKTLMLYVSEKHIAASQLTSCLGTVIFGFLWDKKSEKLFNYYAVFCIIEIIFEVVATTLVVTTSNIIAYYILEMIIYAVITRNIICGGNLLRSLRYRDETRAKYDNNYNIATAVASIIGSLLAIKFDLSFVAMIIIATIGNVIDDLFYIGIYYKTKER